MTRSILSSEEQDLAERLADGDAPADIADDLDRDPEAVEKALDRIREKTDRALATLVESPYAAEAAADLPAAERDRLIARLTDE